jgi:hypothetical protein
VIDVPPKSKTREKARPVLWILLFVAPFAFWWGARVLPDRDARAFCDRMIPRLERFAEENGRFPDSGDAVLVEGEIVPDRFATERWYEVSQDREKYRVQYSSHRFFGGMMYYDSDHGAWRYSTG